MRWPSAGSRVPRTTSWCSPTCPRITWTSTPAWTSTSRSRPACLPRASPGSVSSTPTTSGAASWPAGRRSRSPPSPPPATRAPTGARSTGGVALPGPFNGSNALGAIVALVEAGVSLAAAVTGIAAAPGVPGRLERVECGQDFTVLVDYSHKPGAVEAVLRALRPVTQGRLSIVLGCGGDRDRAKRPLMGAAAVSLADLAILTSDNPRSEDPLAILSEMLQGVLTIPPERRGRVIIE